MKGAFKKIFDLFEVHLPSFIFMILVITIAVQVFARYVFNHPLPKFFELSIYSFVWVIYLGASLAKRFNKHIRFDILYRKFSRKTQLIVDVIFDLLTSSVMLLLVIPSIKYTVINYPIKASALRIPWTYLLICFPLFVILILIHNSVAIVNNISALFGKGTSIEEEQPWL